MVGRHQDMIFSSHKYLFLKPIFQNVSETIILIYPLFHLVAPEGTNLAATSNVAEQGDSVTLTCTVTDSIPSPSAYQFYHYSKLVQESSLDTYTITKIKATDTGNYKCRPVNVVGPGPDATITLKVKGNILCFVFSLLIYLSLTTV